LNCKHSVIDSFLASDEIDLAKFRIDYLRNLVDFVVIVESNVTFSGQEKPLYFTEWLSRSAPEFTDRIIIITPSLDSTLTHWEREEISRDHLRSFLLENFCDSHYIASDIDELPSRDQVTNLSDISGTYHFLTPTSYRKANWQLSDSHKNWQRGLMGTVRDIPDLTLGRFQSFPLITGEPGAHLSYYGNGSVEIARKYASFSHIELNKGYFSEDNLISICDQFRIDHLGRSRSEGFGLFKIVDKQISPVINSISLVHPAHFDSKQVLHSNMTRFFMSVWVTSYLSNGPISNFKRKVFPARFYFRYRVLMLLFPPLIELLFSISFSQKRFLSRMYRRRVKN